MPPILEVVDVVKRFQVPTTHRQTVREHALDFFRPRPTETMTVLNGVAFSVERGETLGIMGRNGCGKSTLLKIAAGIYAPDSGSVVAHAPVTPILELGLGWSPQLDAIDNIELIGTVMGLSLPAVRRATDDILAFAELERFAHLKLQHYSSGMASRLAYAVAFAAVTDVLILDEVFAVGDAGFRAKCEARYRALHAAGTTVVLVTHEARVVSSFCSRAVLLDQGQIRMMGDGPAVAHAYTALLTPRGEATPSGGMR